MFGFGKKPDHYADYLEYLTGSWKMRPRFAAAFLNAYRSEVSALHERVLAGKQAGLDSSSADIRLQAHGMADPHDLALVILASGAYYKDLRQGKHVGTDVETAIWAVLWNRTDLVESLDRLLANHINDSHATKFPNLFETAFSY